MGNNVLTERDCVLAEAIVNVFPNRAKRIIQIAEEFNSCVDSADVDKWMSDTPVGKDTKKNVKTNIESLKTLSTAITEIADQTNDLIIYSRKNNSIFGGE